MKERFRFKKEMGQNFLTDPALIERLAEASGVTKADGVLEIGPGRGLFTAALARRARKVIAVELDRTLINDLEVSLALYPNVQVRQGDILKADLRELARDLGEPCRVAANPPYNITTPLLEKLLHARLPFQSIAVMLQKEAGERIMARPGDAGYGPLSLLISFYAEAELALAVEAAHFTPQPKVDSSFLVLRLRSTPPFALEVGEKEYFRMVRIAFAMRRKTMLNNLMGGLGVDRQRATELLRAGGVDPMARAESLEPEAFARLAAALNE